ncbi:MAG: hypothetical protein L0Y43_10365 [Methylococcaceae bacterium]|nr:hypothetical protein [Methylococcaceae bacterium]
MVRIQFDFRRQCKFIFEQIEQIVLRNAMLGVLKFDRVIWIIAGIFNRYRVFSPVEINFMHLFGTSGLPGFMPRVPREIAFRNFHGFRFGYQPGISVMIFVIGIITGISQAAVRALVVPARIVMMIIGMPDRRFCFVRVGLRVTLLFKRIHTPPLTHSVLNQEFERAGAEPPA